MPTKYPGGTCVGSVTKKGVYFLSSLRVKSCAAGRDKDTHIHPACTKPSDSLLILLISILNNLTVRTVELIAGRDVLCTHSSHKRTCVHGHYGKIKRVKRKAREQLWKSKNRLGERT